MTPGEARRITLRSGLARAAVAAAASWGIGCAEEIGPETMPTAAVSGRVHVRGRSVGGGWIEFRSADGTVGNPRSARLRPDGTFQAVRVPVGRVAVRLVHPPSPLPCGRLFEQIALIRRTVPPVPAGSMDIDLAIEAIRHCPARPFR